MALVNEARLKELEWWSQAIWGVAPKVTELCETVRALRAGLSDALDLAMGDNVDDGSEDSEELTEYRRLMVLWDSVS